MLVTNKTVAKTFKDLEAPFIYRIHEAPDLEKLRELNEMLKNMGSSIKGINKIHPRALATALETFKDDEDYVWIDDICRGDFCDFLISVREEWKEDYPRKALRFIIEPYAPTCIYVGIYEEKDPFSNFMYEYFQNYARYDLLKYYTDLERN